MGSRKKEKEKEEKKKKNCVENMKLKRGNEWRKWGRMNTEEEKNTMIHALTLVRKREKLTCSFKESRERR